MYQNLSYSTGRGTALCSCRLLWKLIQRRNPNMTVMQNLPLKPTEQTTSLQSVYLCSRFLFCCQQGAKALPTVGLPSSCTGSLLLMHWGGNSPSNPRLEMSPRRGAQEHHPRKWLPWSCSHWTRQLVLLEKKTQANSWAKWSSWLVL